MLGASVSVRVNEVAVVGLWSGCDLRRLCCGVVWCGVVRCGVLCCGVRVLSSVFGLIE